MKRRNFLGVLRARHRRPRSCNASGPSLSRRPLKRVATGEQGFEVE
jgi:hypothetical protein